MSFLGNNILNPAPTGGGGGAVIQPGSIVASYLAAGSVTPPKFAANNSPAAGQVLSYVDATTGRWVTPGLTANSVNNLELNAGSATNDYVLTADSTETSGIKWAINAPANSTITPAKIADITVGSGIAGKLLGFNASNHAEFAIIDPFTVSDIGAGEITGTMLADGSVDVPELVIDGTLEAGKVLKLYAKSGGGFGLQVADDNSGGGGGGNVSYPIPLATASNFTGQLGIAQGGTGASTAAAARANLGVQASGGNDGEDGVLPTVTNLVTQPDGHIGEFGGAAADRPSTGTGGGVVVKADDGQYAVSTDGTDAGTPYIRSKTTTVDTAWSSVAAPSPALTSVTTLAQLRAVTNYQTVESTFAAGNPQSTANSIITRIPTEHLGVGFFVAVPPGGLGFWGTQIPSANFAAADLSYSTWETAPLADEIMAIVHRNGQYDQIPAGRVGIVLDLVISSTLTVPVALVHHDYDSDTTTSSFEARFYTTGTAVRESTRGHAHTAGSWVKVRIDTDQIEDEAVGAAQIDDSLVITESDGTAVNRMKVPQLEDVELTGYTLVTTSNPAAGQVGYDVSSRTVVVRAKSGDESLLDEIVARDFEFSIQKTSSGAAASVRGVFSSNPIELAGVLRASLRADDIVAVGTLAANDTVKVTGHKAVYTKLDLIPPVGLGIGHGSAQANHLVKINPSGSAFTAGTLDAANLPVLLADLQALNERLTVRQKLEPRDFGSTYTHSATAAGVTAGRIRWQDTARLLTVNPLAADDKLVEYFSVLGVAVELTSTNGAVIRSTVEAVVANPAGTPSGAITVRLKDLAHHYSGDIRSGNVTVKTLGSFIGRGDTAAVQRDALDAGTGSAGQVLSRTSTGLAWVNQTSGGSNPGANSVDLAQINAGTSAAGQVLAVNSSNDGLDWVNQSGGGTPADNSITHDMLMDGIIENDNMADDSVGTDEIIDGSLRAAAFPTGITDIREISRHLTVEQMIRGRVFGSSYSRVTTGAGLATAGTFRYVESSRTLSITPLAADAELGSYFLPGVRFQLISVSNFNSITGRIQSITTNPAGSATTTVTAILEQGMSIVSGNIGTSSIQIATQGAFIANSDNSVSLDQLLVTGTQSAGSSLVVNSAGTGLSFSPSRSAQILANHQTANGGSISTNSFTDAASLLALPSFEIENLNDMLDFVFTGVLYFNAGAIGSIGIESRLQYRYATTSAGLSTASWNVASIDLTGGLDDAELIFRSKIAAGGTGDGSFRDYMPTITAWGSIDSLTTGPAVGNHIEFRVQFRMPSNSGFNTVNSYYSWRQRVMICPAAS